MDISIDGWGELILALVAVTLLILFGAVIGAVWANKRLTGAQKKSFKQERAELDDIRCELAQRELGLDGRQRELNDREDVLDEHDRSLVGREAELDQREAAITARELLFATRPSSVRGW